MKVIPNEIINQQEYKFIFEYYDEPLAFISTFENRNFLLYMMDDNKYFIKELNRDNIKFIFSDVSINNMLEDFKQSGDLKILINDNNKFSLYGLLEYDALFDDSWSEYLPEDDLYFEYDFLSNKSFSEIMGDFKSAFPEYFGVNKLLYKLIDRYNSHIMPADTVAKIIEYVQKYVTEIKEHLEIQGKFTNEELKVAPFGEGSFEINFIIDEKDEKALFKEPILFDNMIESFYALKNYDPEYIFEREFFNEREYDEAKKLFMYMDERNLKAELLNSKKQIVGTIVPTDSILEKFENIDSLISQEKELVMKTETKKFVGEVRSASKERNYIRIKLNNEHIIQAKFSKDLFSEIKESIRSITVSSSIEGEFKVEKYYNKENDLIKEKHVIIDYKQ